MKKIFFSYSHKDELIKELIDTHLTSLNRSKKIEVWNDRMIKAGADWDNTIKLQLEEADIILILVSANFNASKYIWEVVWGGPV